MKARTRLFAGTALAAVVATACSGDEPAVDPGVTDTQLSIVVTTTIWGDLVNRLVQDDASVEVLLEPGQDPHAFAPSARQAAAVRNADLVVANGLQLEEGLLDLLGDTVNEGGKVFEVAPLLDPIDSDDPEHGEESEKGHEGEHSDEGPDEHLGEQDQDDHGPEDPHVWHDPVRMAEGVTLLADKLAELDSTLDDVEWDARGAELADDILAAHASAEELLASVPRACRTLVTNHDSLAYFAERHDFDVVGTVIPGTSTNAEADAAGIARLAGVIRDAGVPAIFAETTESTRLAETLADEVGDVTVVELHTESLAEPGTGADSYIGLVTTNAQLIADALASCTPA